jgi:hypothetical protein
MLRNNRDILFSKEAGERLRREIEARALARVRGKDKESRAVITTDDIASVMKAAGYAVRSEDYQVAPPEPQNREKAATWDNID